MTVAMRSIRILTALALALALLVSGGTQASPGPGVEEGPTAWVSLTVANGRPTRLVVTGRPPGDIGGALARISGGPAQTREYENGWAQWSCDLPAPVREALVLRQELRLAPLLQTLRAAGQTSVVVLVQHPSVGFVALSGAKVMAAQSGFFNASVSTATRGPLRLELGWRRADVARAAGILLLAFLAPILAALLIWRRSIARDRTAERWFVRAYSIQILLVVGWALWLTAVEATRVVALGAFALESRGASGPALTPLWYLGFFPATLALVAIARANTRRLRGFDAAPGTGRLFASLRAMLALALLVVAMASFTASDWKAGVFALLAAIAVVVLLPGARGPLGTRPQSLSTGALRDRLFDLATRAGVRLRELYVVPMRRERMANAFAVSGGVVMISDELLDRMSKREVDAVMAHEISHLEHQHPRLMVLTAAAVWVLLAGVALPLRMPYVAPIGLAASWLAYLFVARRCELAADAGAAALTGDAEAMISGLGRLARLNDAPLAWSRGIAWLVTHPSTEARGRAMGRRAGLAPDRVAALLRDGLAVDERYGEHERPGEEQRVFSTPWKAAFTMRLGMTMLAIAAAVPAAALAIAGVSGVAVPGTAAVLGGALLGFVALLIAQDALGAHAMSRLEPAIRRRLGADAAEGASFVALSPGDQPRVYEGFHDWDLGLLEIDAEVLRYRGEQLALAIPRAAVRSIEVGARAPSWIPAPRVVVRWSSIAGDEALSLRPAHVRRVHAIGAASRALAARLEAWRAAGAAGDAPLGPAGIGEVTGRTPAQAAAPRDVPLLVVLLGTFSAAAAFLLGFDFWRGLEVFAAAFIAVMMLRGPMMVWRARRSKSAGPAEERRAA
jgi:Zn-dependent protease with chaperone function